MCLCLCMLVCLTEIEQFFGRFFFVFVRLDFCLLRLLLLLFDVHHTVIITVNFDSYCALVGVYRWLCVCLCVWSGRSEALIFVLFFGSTQGHTTHNYIYKKRYSDISSISNSFSCVGLSASAIAYKILVLLFILYYTFQI